MDCKSELKDRRRVLGKPAIELSLIHIYETSREGMRVCIELRRDVNPNIVLNQLYKHTQLQDKMCIRDSSLCI